MFQMLIRYLFCVCVFHELTNGKPYVTLIFKAASLLTLLYVCQNVLNVIINMDKHVCPVQLTHWNTLNTLLMEECY